MAKTANVDTRGLTEERLLTPEQVAARLQLSPITIIHWLRAQKLPGVKLGGKLWRVRESDLLHFIEALSNGQTPRPTAEGRAR